MTISQAKLTGGFIHPSAVVDAQAVLGKGVKVGPYCVVGPHVTLGDNVELISHISVDGHTTIGENTVIYPFASLGHAPQDLKYAGEASTLVIGKNNKIREYVTLQPGTLQGRMTTIIGDDCLFMASSHVAHDCIIGNNVIMANNATLGGHVIVGDHAILGGLSAVHQFVRIGEHAIIGGMSGVERDVIPYGLVAGERAHLAGLNLVGLKRRGFSSQAIQTLMKAYDSLFDYSSEDPLSSRAQKVAQQFSECAEVQHIIEFITKDNTRSICQPKS